MSVVTRQVTWGEALMVETSKNGGLRHIVDSITAQMGEQGTRNTFGKLLAVTNPDTLKPRDQWRAWVLLSAMDLDPAEWGIYADVIPPHIDGELLRDRLISAVNRAKGQTKDYGSVDSVADITKEREKRSRPMNRNDTHGPKSRAA